MNKIFSEEINVEMLFRFADVDGDGMIGVEDALFFFNYTKLQMNVLSKIWSVSVPPRSPMYINEFTKALVLIGFAQKGVEVSEDLLRSQPPFPTPKIEIPFFMKIDDIKSFIVHEEIRIELNPPITTLLITDVEIKNGFMVLQDDIRLHFMASSEDQRDIWTSAFESL